MADFRLGRLKFNWRNAWTPTTEYEIDDIVKFGGNTYVCVVNHTSAASESAFYTTDLLIGTPKWNLHVPGFENKGTWTQGTFYKLNDLVSYGGNLYITTTQHTSTSTFASGNFAVFVPGLQFEDSWDSGTSYQPGDVVTYGGYTYIALTSNLNAPPSASINTNWDVLTTGFKVIGEWNSSTTYTPGNVVQYGGNTYVANVQNSNSKPPSSQVNWSLVQTGIKWRGSWSALNDYKVGEIAFKNASSYINIQEYSVAVDGAKDPETASAYWELFAQGDNTTNISTQLAAVKAAALTYSITFGL